MDQTFDRIADYKRLRALGRDLNNRIVALVGGDVLKEAGRRLGVLRGRTFVLGSEDEMGAVADYGVHNVRRRDCNGIERFLIRHAVDLDDDQVRYLKAVLGSRFSLFAVEDIEPGAGVRLRDLIFGSEFFLYDIGLSQSASSDIVIATRVFSVSGITMTTGSPLLVGKLGDSGVDDLLEFVRQVAKDTDQLSVPQIADVLRRVIQMRADEEFDDTPASLSDAHRTVPRGERDDSQGHTSI